MDEIHLQTRIACALDNWFPKTDSMISNSVAQALNEKSDRGFFDLLKPIDDCSVIALEIKVVEPPNFKSFDYVQRRVLQAAFEAGVPVFYCFNDVLVITKNNALQCCSTALPHCVLASDPIPKAPRFSSNILSLEKRVIEVQSKQSATGIGELIACGAIAHNKHANIKGLIFFAMSKTSVELLDPEFVQLAFEKYCKAFVHSPSPLEEMEPTELTRWFLKMRNTARAQINAAFVMLEKKRQQAEDSESSRYGMGM